MKPWPQMHKNLATLVLFAVLAFTVGYIIFIRPKQKDVARLQAEADELQKTLQAKGWPLDGTRLESLFDERSRELKRLVDRSNEIPGQSTAMFDIKIKKDFESREGFRNNVTRLDFQEQFIQIEQAFKEKGVVFYPAVLNLSENTDSPYTYQLMLQLWTLQAILDLALTNDLRPLLVNPPKVEGASRDGNIRVSQVTVLPLKAYFTSAEEKEPYLLEFPIQLVVQGKLSGLVGFLRALHADDNFYPVTNLELRKAVPGRNRALADQIEADIQCSSFYRLRDTAPRVSPAKIKLLPPGA